MAQQARSEGSSATKAESRALTTPLHHAHAFYQNQHTVFSDRVFRPFYPTRSFALGTLVWYQAIEDTPTQESHVHVSTPAVHAQIAHEFCHGPITFPPSSEPASSRRDQWHSGKLPMPEGPRWLDLSCPALLHIADPTEHQAHAHPNGPRQWSLPEVTPAPTCGLGPIHPRRKNTQQNSSNPPSCMYSSGSPSRYAVLMVVLAYRASNLVQDRSPKLCSIYHLRRILNYDPRLGEVLASHQPDKSLPLLSLRHPLGDKNTGDLALHTSSPKSELSHGHPDDQC
ncbi:hypothetical protein BKA70DRAFT_1466334 [Coprinopsis sp. MPI-PUGE-AT-0042]|nr:hypothetical protein BKA70DRAFT_1466334 [Coprinopsis sp. MPI-PUGE-AT-0042]